MMGISMPKGFDPGPSEFDFLLCNINGHAPNPVDFVDGKPVCTRCRRVMD